jgi:hypothetical protein
MVVWVTAELCAVLVSILGEAGKSQAAVVRGHDIFPVLPKPRKHGRVDLCSLVAAVHLKHTALCVWVMDNRVQVSSVQAILQHHHWKFLFSPLFN